MQLVVCHSQLESDFDMACPYHLLLPVQPPAVLPAPGPECQGGTPAGVEQHDKYSMRFVVCTHSECHAMAWHGVVDRHEAIEDSGMV